MDKRFVATGISLWSILGVPIVFAVGANWLYYYHLGKGELPPSWAGLGLLVACLVSGLATVGWIPIVRNKGLWLVVLVEVAYALLMGSVLFVLGVTIACNHGDCL